MYTRTFTYQPNIDALRQLLPSTQQQCAADVDKLASVNDMIRYTGNEAVIDKSRKLAIHLFYRAMVFSSVAYNFFSAIFDVDQFLDEYEEFYPGLITGVRRHTRVNTNVEICEADVSLSSSCINIAHLDNDDQTDLSFESVESEDIPDSEATPFVVVEVIVDAPGSTNPQNDSGVDTMKDLHVHGLLTATKSKASLDLVLGYDLSPLMTEPIRRGSKRMRGNTINQCSTFESIGCFGCHNELPFHVSAVQSDGTVRHKVGHALHLNERQLHLFILFKMFKASYPGPP